MPITKIEDFNELMKAIQTSSPGEIAEYVESITSCPDYPSYLNKMLSNNMYSFLSLIVALPEHARQLAEPLMVKDIRPYPNKEKCSDLNLLTLLTIVSNLSNPQNLITNAFFLYGAAKHFPQFSGVLIQHVLNNLQIFNTLVQCTWDVIELIRSAPQRSDDLIKRFVSDWPMARKMLLESYYDSDEMVRKLQKSIPQNIQETSLIGKFIKEPTTFFKYGFIMRDTSFIFRINNNPDINKIAWKETWEKDFNDENMIIGSDHEYDSDYGL